MFADGRSAVEVGGLLEVSTKSAYQWRRVWIAGGAQSLASKGPSGPEPKAVFVGAAAFAVVSTLLLAATPDVRTASIE